MTIGPPDTGNQATFALDGFTVNITSIKTPKLEVVDVKTDHLLTEEFLTYIAGDLIEPGEVTITYEFDSTVDMVLPKASGTGTITFPVPEGFTDGATIAGSGYVKSNEGPDLKNNELQMGTLVFKFDGVTGPAFTAASA